MDKKTLDRFWSKVKKTDYCGKWTASKDSRGYGRFRFNKKMIKAYRFSYELFNKPIQKDLQIDHLCRNTSCVNPDHLEVVTQKENMKRGIAWDYQRNKTCCPKGHEYSKENTYLSPNGKRNCIECRKMAKKRHYRSHRRECIEAAKKRNKLRLSKSIS